MKTNRRSFMASILAAGMAPAIVHAANLMPVFVRQKSGLFVPGIAGDYSITPDSGILMDPAPYIGSKGGVWLKMEIDKDTGRQEYFISHDSPITPQDKIIWTPATARKTPRGIEIKKGLFLNIHQET